VTIDAHLHFQGLEPAVSKHSVLRMVDYTSSITCHIVFFYANTHFAYPRGMTGLSWPGWLIKYQEGVIATWNLQTLPKSVLSSTDVEQLC